MKDIHSDIKYEPKYKRFDIVNFEVDGKQFTGKICVVDRYGTFGQNEEPSYDIWVNDACGEDMI